MIPFDKMTKEEASKFMVGKEDQPIRAVMAERVGGRSVIDFGCGRGIHVTRDYDPKQYYGLDCSPELVALASKSNPLHLFSVWDIRKVPPLKRPKVVIIKSVLEHQPCLEDALSVFTAALDTADEVLVCWHTFPEEPYTIISRVPCELSEPIYQNAYKEGSFNLENVSIEKERVDQFQLWTCRRRGLRTDI